MSQVPPAPPPPPQKLTLGEFKLNPKALTTSPVLDVDENELGLLVEKFVSSETKFRKTFYVTNTRLKPQLQDGPKCGLVALSIATSGIKNFVKVEDIFNLAVSHGFTKQGEMFSTSSLALLAEKCGFKTRIITQGLTSHLCCILKSLLKNCLLLIPYDADFNHAPCCKKGSKAHWAVITGFIIFAQENSEPNARSEDFVFIDSSSCSQCRDSSDNLPLTVSVYQGRILVGKGQLKETSDCFNEGKVYLIGMQGKSRHIALWSLEEMAKSNNNLVLFPNAEYANYVFPEGGIEEGLKGKVIILDSF